MRNHGCIGSICLTCISNHRCYWFYLLPFRNQSASGISPFLAKYRYEWLHKLYIWMFHIFCNGNKIYAFPNMFDYSTCTFMSPQLYPFGDPFDDFVNIVVGETDYAFGCSRSIFLSWWFVLFACCNCGCCHQTCSRNYTFCKWHIFLHRFLSVDEADGQVWYKAFQWHLRRLHHSHQDHNIRTHLDNSTLHTNTSSHASKLTHTS